jgi:hypothetical protein
MAQCPFCNGVLTAKDLLPGAKATCPRCGSLIGDVLLTQPSAVTAHQAAAPVAPSFPVTRNDPGDARVAVDDTPDDEDESPAPASVVSHLRHLDGVTAAAWFCGSMAFFLASVPPLSYLTKPLSALGLVLALVASLVPAVRKQTSVVFPLAAGALCLVLVVLVGKWPRLGTPAPPPPVAVPFGQKGMVANQPIGDGDWVDASTHAVQKEDLRVRVLAARIGTVELVAQGKENSPPGQARPRKYDEPVTDPLARRKKVWSQDKQLVIRLQVTYQGALFRAIPYQTWADLVNVPSKHPPILTDTLKRPYAQKTYDAAWKVVGRVDGDTLTPGHMVNEVLVFPVPPAGVESLRLTLPAAAFGGTGEFHFLIPRGMIEFS